MKIIQSFWSAGQKVLNDNFGWHSPRFHAISWALSSLQLSKFYNVELYTDSIGYDFLIKKLDLPYKKVHVVLDRLNNFPSNFWALPKIQSYMLQKEPFIHFDGDVFLFKPLPDTLLKGSIISQNLEVTTDYYEHMWNEIYPHLTYIPEEITGYIKNKKSYACNMGIFGGNDINFIHDYSLKAYDFAKNNIQLSQKINSSNFNIFFEQVYLYELLTIQNKKSSYLIDEISLDNEYIGFGNFHEVPFKRTYLHLLGSYKRIYSVCRLLEIYFISYYPEYFKKIFNIFPDNYKYFNNLGKYNFTLQENIDRFNFFIKNVINDSTSYYDENYLFNRDISCIRLHKILFDKMKFEQDFFIKRIKGNYIEKIVIKEESIEEKCIKIKEINDKDSIIYIDEIDEILLEKIRNKISFNKLQREMLELLDEEAVGMAMEFRDMIKERVIYFLKNRILIIF